MLRKAWNQLTNGLSVKICCYSQLAFLRKTLLSCVGAKKEKWLKVLSILYGNWLVLMGLCFCQGHSFPRVKSVGFYPRFCWFNLIYFRCYKQEKKFYYWYPLHSQQTLAQFNNFPLIFSTYLFAGFPGLKIVQSGNAR